MAIGTYKEFSPFMNTLSFLMYYDSDFLIWFLLKAGDTSLELGMTGH
jgi:hypothetical protein